MGEIVIKEGEFEIYKLDDRYNFYANDQYVATFGNMWAAVGYMEDEWGDLLEEL